MNSLFDEFRTICSHLNQVGITPTLMGSLGFEYRSNEEWGLSLIHIYGKSSEKSVCPSGQVSLFEEEASSDEDGEVPS